MREDSEDREMEETDELEDDSDDPRSKQDEVETSTLVLTPIQDGWTVIERFIFRGKELRVSINQVP